MRVLRLLALALLLWTSPAWAAIAYTSLDSGVGSGTSITTASVTPCSNCLVLISILFIGSTGQSATTVTGNGLTWVQIDYNDVSPNAGGLYRALGASPSTGVITITPASSATVQWSVITLSGTDTSGTNGSGAIVQNVPAFSNGVSSLTVTLSAFGNAANATYGAFFMRDAATPTVGSGFTVAHSLNNAAVLFTEYELANNTAVAAFYSTSTDILGYGVEVKAAVAASANTTISHPITISGPTTIK